MDMVIAGELAVIIGLMIWGRSNGKPEVQGETKPPIEPEVAPPVQPVYREAPKPVFPRVEIVKLNEDKTVNHKIRDEYMDHPDIEKVWADPDLAIRLPYDNDRLLMSKEDL